MPAKPSQAGRVLHAQDIRHVRGGVRHDRVRWVHEPTKTDDLCDILQETRETPRTILVQ